MCSLNEILFVIAITVAGILSITGLLYLIFKKTLTYKLWVGLVPGVFAFTLCIYIWGHLQCVQLFGYCCCTCSRNFNICWRSAPIGKKDLCSSPVYL